MLACTGANGGSQPMMLVHQDYAQREWTHGAETKSGTFRNALMAAAKQNGWTVISMKGDWKHVFAFEKSGSGPSGGWLERHLDAQ